MNPFYQSMMNNGMVPQMMQQMPVQQQPMMSSGQTFQNPVQKMQYIMQAMTNPAAFVRQRFPDIPNQIANDPNQIFNYLQQTRNPVNNGMIQQAQQMIPR